MVIVKFSKKKHVSAMLSFCFQVSSWTEHDTIPKALMITKRGCINWTNRLLFPISFQKSLASVLLLCHHKVQIRLNCAVFCGLGGLIHSTRTALFPLVVLSLNLKKQLPPGRLQKAGLAWHLQSSKLSFLQISHLTVLLKNYFSFMLKIVCVDQKNIDWLTTSIFNNCHTE